MRPQLAVCIFLRDDRCTSSVSPLVESDRYVITLTNSAQELHELILENGNVDCLVLEEYPELRTVTQHLRDIGIVLPAVIITGGKTEGDTETVLLTERNETENYKPKSHFFYHRAEIHLPTSNVDDIGQSIDKAISQYLNLSSNDHRLLNSEAGSMEKEPLKTFNRQQGSLAEKLRERLGYLGVYYKRNPQIFLRNMSPGERQKFMEQLRAKYRQIVLNYFDQESALNNQIDEFVNLTFFADVPVTQIVEMHMELMEEFSKQLQIEGRSEEILLDYRLTLIDTLAHLCEMYRRSIPRES